ncbi:hypothetical protein CAEBREN_22761 [Caenorhabditis brenneri]|uniref:BHLH domain-containing protein n=1 Tax=Caenorhabditis brenneri TaxID=135651 RepID=G0P3X9_CAEBE|nr:hypothetical protein CAEBREN_22761 [Caenorhabditis brenneri]
MEAMETVTPAPRKTKKQKVPKPPRIKKETAVKKESRSRHEKKRREEMNEVINEMMELLPEGTGPKKSKKGDHKPRHPDKCFIIGSSVDMIKNSDWRPGLLTDPVTRDVFGLANSFMIFLNNFIITAVEGEYRSVFDIEKNRMLGRDIRCFLDFESGSRLSFLEATQLLHQFQLRSFLAKSMTCKMKTSPESPSDAILVCVPDDLPKIPEVPKTAAPVEVAPPASPPPSEMEKSRPILAALLRRKDPPLETSTPSTSSFLSPSSSNSTLPFPIIAPVNATPIKTTRKINVPQGPQKRKRLRSMNVIVETFPLDAKEEEKPPKKTRKRQSAPTTTTTSSNGTNTAPICTPAIIQPIPTTHTMTMNPFDVLAPGYRDIWLRLQSERLLLEERISAKEGELKNLMHIVQPPTPFMNFPQYLLPQGALSAQNQL